MCVPALNCELFVICFNDFQQRLADHGPLYFTISARNCQGVISKAFCTLETFDVIPPVGKVKPAFRKSSDPSFLKMEGVVFAHAPNHEVRVAVGFSPGIRGDTVVPWKKVIPQRMFGPPGPHGEALIVFYYTVMACDSNLKSSSFL